MFKIDANNEVGFEVVQIEVEVYASLTPLLLERACPELSSKQRFRAPGTQPNCERTNVEQYLVKSLPVVVSVNLKLTL